MGVKVGKGKPGNSLVVLTLVTVLPQHSMSNLEQLIRVTVLDGGVYYPDSKAGLTEAVVMAEDSSRVLKGYLLLLDRLTDI